MDNKTIGMKQARNAYRRAWTIQVTHVDPSTKRETRTRKPMMGAPGFRRWARIHYASTSFDMDRGAVLVGKLFLICRR